MNFEWKWSNLQTSKKGNVMKQCGNYIGVKRCTRKAIHWIVNPDGKDNPGGKVCEECGTGVVTEYKEKLEEVWTLRPLTEIERM